MPLLLRLNQEIQKNKCSADTKIEKDKYTDMLNTYSKEKISWETELKSQNNICTNSVQLEKKILAEKIKILSDKINLIEKTTTTLKDDINNILL